MVQFSTTKVIHLHNHTKNKITFLKKNKDYIMKFYKERDYDLRVMKKRPGVIREYLGWSLRKKILYGTCLIIGEEGGIYCHKYFKPNSKINELVLKNKFFAMRENGEVIFICSPPADHLYEKIQENSVEWIDYSMYGKYTPPKKINIENVVIIFFILVVVFGFSIILGLKLS